MEFAFSLKKNNLSDFNLKRKTIVGVFDVLSSDYYFQKSENGDWIIWIGDFVLPDEFKSIEDFLKEQLKKPDQEKLLETGGYFYCIRHFFKKNSLQVVTGFLNIMPVYYFENHEKIWIASKNEWIANHSDIDSTVNLSFILEKLLFNYPFENDTIYKGIKMLSGNHYLQVDQTGIKEIRYKDILDFIVTDPAPVNKSLDFLVDLLNNRIDAYFPEDEFYLSFTGGFDGRTILSRALFGNKNPLTYSFGTKNSSDITIPAAQAKELGVQFRPFFLDKEEYLRNSLKYGFELVEVTAALSNFARAHYVYAAKQISNTHKYIMTGNFGSELFRAFHNTGVMVTPFLFQLFNTTNIEKFLETYSFPEFSCLNKDIFKNEFLSLRDRIITGEMFSKPGFTKNQVFYRYVFEEIFRKYFGAELIMQNEYLYNRTPYIDYMLIKELLKTKFAGIYSDFYENNPVKRLKGQLLYAHCIKMNSPQIYKMKTGKGYPPKNIITPEGKFYLLWNLINKKIKNKKRKQNDDFGVVKSFEKNNSILLEMQFDENYFDERKIKKEITGEKNNLNNLINIISLNWYLLEHFEKNG